MKKIFILLLFSISFVIASAQNGVVKGFVYDITSGEPIMFANIIVENTSLGASTDINGFFVINKVPKGKQILKIQNMRLADTTINVHVIREKTINKKIKIRPKSQT